VIMTQLLPTSQSGIERDVQQAVNRTIESKE
jgi:hypothetical protein